MRRGANTDSSRGKDSIVSRVALYFASCGERKFIARRAIQSWTDVRLRSRTTLYPRADTNFRSENPERNNRLTRLRSDWVSLSRTQQLPLSAVLHHAGHGAHRQPTVFSRQRQHQLATRLQG